MTGHAGRARGGKQRIERVGGLALGREGQQQKPRAEDDNHEKAQRDQPRGRELVQFQNAILL